MTVECDLSVHRTEPLIDCPVETSTIAAYNLLYRALSEQIVNLLGVHSLKSFNWLPGTALFLTVLSIKGRASDTCCFLLGGWVGHLLTDTSRQTKGRSTSLQRQISNATSVTLGTLIRSSDRWWDSKGHLSQVVLAGKNYSLSWRNCSLTRLYYMILI